MQSIPVNTGAGYMVRIGAGLLPCCGTLLRAALPARRVAVVTDDNVEKLYLPIVLRSLAEAGFTAGSFVFPAGERSKRLSTVSDMLEAFAAMGLERRDCVLALGGGVTGDMAGFAAGCYMRGVRLVQLPTTLLAAVDASVGGKTGVDLGAGKNLAGLFVRPELVLCDTDCLLTLPRAVFCDGMAEVIKTALLFDAPLFVRLERGIGEADYEDVIAKCVGYKAEVVSEDEREQGRRRLLNLGHTLGHAIEKCSGYTLPHGHAVAAGMAILSRGAERLGLCEEPVARRIMGALTRYELPVTTQYTAEALVTAALADKKRAGDTLTLPLPLRIGAACLRDVTIGELRALAQAGLTAWA